MRRSAHSQRPAKLRSPARQWIVVGNPENRRIQFLQEALARCGLPPAIVVRWLEVIQDGVVWPKLVRDGAVLRIESSGENFAVERMLIAAGAESEELEGGEHSPQKISARRALCLREDHGCILYPRQWYLGFSRVLERLDERLRDCRPHLRLQSSADVRVMFDKVDCQQRLSDAGIVIPRSVGSVRSYDELLWRMDAAAVNRVFIKLAHGSSACGVVAYERSRTSQQAFTSAEIVRKGRSLKLYNSLKIRRYRDSRDIAALIDTLARERVHVEAWIPKASLNGKRFDLRVVVIDSRARHVVVRMGASPMTNLHLGNSRGDAAEIQRLMGGRSWSDAMSICERAMTVFPDSLYAGLDLLIGTDLNRHAVLEVNAFGDLLPRVLHDGLSTYEAEVEAVMQRTAALSVPVASSSNGDAHG